MTEQDLLEEEEKRTRFGAEPRDLTQYTSWRETTDGSVLEAIDFYGAYLMGQTNGLSDALSLPALAAAFDIEEIDLLARGDLAQRVLRVHGAYMTTFRSKDKPSHGR